MGRFQENDLMARTVQTIDDLKALISSKGGVARSNVFAVALPPIAD